ncbi:hypothetical protein QAD02_020773 [Eretmocerus hayati]|uniref:Uncharacterized protein n=1 Tax=Eretmocerus hayati TaxID=131215 RepID=A0ACC2PNG0_9HYME|nr:hypothetical protein QAD02_020773 [Eretmocerus hayati]
MQEAMGSVIIPRYLKNAFNVYGLAKGPLLAKCTESHIEALQDFVRSPYYATLVPSEAKKVHFSGKDHCNKPELSEFGIGDSLLISKMIDFARAQALDFWDPFSAQDELHTYSRNARISAESRSFIDVLVETQRTNKDRDDRGNRYSRGLQMFCAFLKMTASRLVYEILSEVFLKSIPKRSAINRFIHKESEKIVEGQFRADELKKFLEDRNLPLEVSMSENACAIISKIQCDALTDQGVGNVLPIDENSMPISGSCKYNPPHRTNFQGFEKINITLRVYGTTSRSRCSGILPSYVWN